MNLSVFIFLGFANLLVAIIVSFIFTFLLKMKALGGFWAAFVIALIGAFSGTVIGIFFESRRIFDNMGLIRYSIPFFTSVFLLFIFLKISQWHSNE